MRKENLFAVGALLLTSFAHAQDSLKRHVMKEVVVSATRTEQPVLEISRSVSVIGRASIEKAVVNSVGELLAQQEGIYLVGATQTPGSNQSIFMRGANSNQMVVMIDGKRITDPSTPGSSVDLSELSLANVERIEIIRGSHSTVYGGSAIGGVINIITRKGGTTGFHGNAGLQAGTFGNGSSTISENADIRYTAENGLYVNGGVFDQHVDGLDATIKQEVPPGTYATHDKDGFRKTDVMVKAGYFHDKWDLSASFKKTDQRSDIDNGAFMDDDNYYLDFNRNLFDYNLSYKINSNWKLTALGSYSVSDRLSVNDSSVIDEGGNYDKSYFRGSYTGKIQTHELQLNFDTQKMKVMMGGGVYHDQMYFDTYYFSNQFGPYESIVNYDTIDISTTTTYAFGQVRYAIGNLNLLGGARYSHHSLFGNNVTFEFNPGYKINSILVFGSITSGYNAPSLYQLYDPTQGFGAYTTRGNPDLDPEKSMSYEVGVKQEFKTGSFVSLSAFTTRVKNSIEYIYLWNGGKAIDALDYTDYRGDTYVNIASQSTSGLELATFVDLTKVHLQGNITLMKGEVSADVADLDEETTGGNHVQLYNFGTFLTEDFDNGILARRPKVTAFAQVEYAPVTKFSMSLAYRYAGSRYDVAYDGSLGPYGALGQVKIDEYHLFDFGANFRISRFVTASLKVENIFDQTYQEIQGFQTRGRSGYLRIMARW